MTLARRFNAG